MSTLRPTRDPLDKAREDLEQATAHLDRIRERVEHGQLDGQALTMAELRAKHARDRWQALIRGDDGGVA